MPRKATASVISNGGQLTPKLNDILETINFAALAPEDLDKLASHITSARTQAVDRHRNEVRDHLASLAQDKGFKIEDLFKKVYRNPDNPSQVWSGKGKAPGWAKAWLAAGKGRTLDQLEV